MSACVLLIEDNQENLDLMTYLLQAYGYRPLVARDGEEGLTVARSERPDLIVCDIQMPKLDGYGVARELKRDAQLRLIPLVAVTAYAMVGDRDKMLAAGFDGYIAKPINPETFISQVEAFLPLPLRSPECAVAPAATPAAGVEAKLKATQATVLVVDNLASKRYLVRSILQPSHYEVLEAGSVDEGLALARQTQPDLIISDLHMPQKSGFDLAREVRADPQLQQIPILIHSATSMAAGETEQCEPSDRCRFLLSPIDPERLLDQVRDILKSKSDQ